MTPPEFLMQIAPAAQACMKETGIPASVTLAQGALESGWGRSQLALQAYNLFGIKADPSWHGPVLSMQTGEVVKGASVIVPATWRKYADWQACIDDHARFLKQNPRYAVCFAAVGGEAWAHALQAAGYSTSPVYADSLIAVMRGRSLINYDRTPP